MNFVTNWAMRRRGATLSVAKDFASWYGHNNCTHSNLAEAWEMFEMNSWKIQNGWNV